MSSPIQPPKKADNKQQQEQQQRQKLEFRQSKQLKFIPNITLDKWWRVSTSTTLSSDWYVIYRLENDFDESSKNGKQRHFQFTCHLLVHISNWCYIYSLRNRIVDLFYSHFLSESFNPLSANVTKWWNTLKQFVGKLPTNCLSVFDYFVGLALKRLSYFQNQSLAYHVCI